MNPAARFSGARPIVVGMWAACASLASGCAVYHREPLPTRPDLLRAPALTVPARSLALPGLVVQHLDPARGLTEINIVTLAVADNPALKAERRRAGIARAQLLEAGLLPDPQLSGGLSRSSFLTGYSAALTEDIRTLITRGAAESAARAHLEQVNLEILWQEWQIAERARELFIQARALEAEGAVADRERSLLARLYREDQAELARHEVRAGAVTADFAAWDTAEARWRMLELERNAMRHALDELLGLAPTIRLRLRGEPGSEPITAAQYRSALASLPRRRPDLLALAAGYHSEEERLREAILAQFPLLTAGVEKRRSAEDNVQTIGFNVTLTLPIFNRNRGPIAVARASRAYLREAYQARLDETASQADRVRRAVRIMQRQMRTLDARAAQLGRQADAAHASLERGELTLADYARVDSNALSARIEAIELRASLEQARAALATLLALPF